MDSNRLYAIPDTIPAGTAGSLAYVNIANYKPLSVIFPANWTLCDVIFSGSPDLINAGFLTSTNTGLRYRLSNAHPSYQFMLPSGIFITTRYLVIQCLNPGTDVLRNQVNTVTLNYYCKLIQDVPPSQPS
jgi:hypothetical protein